MKFIGIIPARYNSARFPGKPLADISGKIMIQRVYEQSIKVLNTVYVATDDERIKKAVEDFGGNVVMTSDKHQSGTDRCNEAIKIIQNTTKKKYDVVINIQGDEPFIHPSQIKKIINCFDDKNTKIATLIKKIDDNFDLKDINKPKVIINLNKEAIYFSRFPIPYIRAKYEADKINENDFYKHIGIYAYKTDVLKKIAKLKPSSLEKAESLEQLRWIENGYKIKVEFTKHESASIDTKEDLQRLIKNKPV